MMNYFWRGDRVVEGARLESECAPQGYHGFESHPLRVFFCATIGIFNIYLYTWKNLKTEL